MTKRTLKHILETKSINLEFKIKNTIFTNLKKHIKSDSKLLVAVSWWSDSIFLSVLLRDFFLKNNLDTNDIYFIHLNHNTRKNNIKDEIFIKNFFEWTNLIIKTRTNNLTKTENNLRKWRYQEIKQTAIKHKIDLILFGHNLTDRLESTFMNMLRWCGLQWFKSMWILQPHHLLDKNVLRPLIDLTKNEITEICKKHGIQHIEDETNNNPKISLRNLIRIKLLPQIFKLSNKKDEFSNSFIQSMQTIYKQIDQEEPVHNLLKEITRSPYRNSKFGYELNIFKTLITQEQLIFIIKKLWIYKNTNKNFIKELYDFIVNKEDWFKYFNKTYFWISHSKVYIINAPEDFRTKTIDKKLSINKLWNIELWKLSILIDKKDMIWSIIRFPKQWDKFKNKTRNQYCISQKIPIFRRNFIPLVEKDWKIIHSFKDLYIL